MDADRCGAATGVTTLVDAGSSGAHLFGAFRRSAVERTEQRILALLNISTIGTTSIRLARELEDLRYSSIEDCVNCLLGNDDILVGVTDSTGKHVKIFSGLDQSLLDTIDPSEEARLLDLLGQVRDIFRSGSTAG